MKIVIDLQLSAESVRIRTPNRFFEFKYLYFIHNARLFILKMAPFVKNRILSKYALFPSQGV